MKNSKIVIWGHPLHSHTHSYIHHGYFRAFKSLGFDTVWLNGSPCLSEFPDNTIFFTEWQAAKHMPIKPNYKYILHHCDNNKMIQIGAVFENIVNIGNIIESTEIFDKINDLCYWDNKSRTLYQSWATNLLPLEIDTLSPALIDESKSACHYIGSIYDEGRQYYIETSALLKSKNKTLSRHASVSDADNLSLVRDSYLSFDIRANWHKECGYIPCRIYKNTSYGKLTGTNSLKVFNKLPEICVYGETPKELINNLIEANIKETSTSLRARMNFVKENHTYINRVEQIMRFFK